MDGRLKNVWGNHDVLNSKLKFCEHFSRVFELSKLLHSSSLPTVKNGRGTATTPIPIELLTYIARNKVDDEYEAFEAAY